MTRKPFVWALLTVLIAGIQSFGQQPVPSREESRKYRTIFTVAGGGGGYTLGVFGGIAAFEDSTYGSKKVWTTALISAAGGAVGGYFLGRHLDKRRSAATPIPVKTPDLLERSLELAGRPFSVPYLEDSLIRQLESRFRYSK